MSNKAVLDALIIGTPTTNVGQFNLFGDGSVSGALNVGTLVSDSAFSITSNNVISNSGDTKIIDSFHTDDFRAATYAITVDGSSDDTKRFLFTTLYLLQDEDDENDDENDDDEEKKVIKILKKKEDRSWAD